MMGMCGEGGYMYLPECSDPGIYTYAVEKEKKTCGM